LEVGTHLKINFSTICYQPFKFKSFGYNNLRTIATPTFQFGFGYNKILKKNWILDWGIQYSLMGFRNKWYVLDYPYINEEFVYPDIILNTTYLDHRFTIETGLSKALYISNDFYLKLSYMPALNMFKLDSDYLIENFLSDFNGNIIV